MNGIGLGRGSGHASAGVALLLATVVATGCDLTSGPDDKPTTAVIRIEGTSPNPLKLITSTNFTEQYNAFSMEYTAVLFSADTVEITLPYEATNDMGPLASIYVELLQPEKGTASVRLRVDLDNGEGYDQRADLTDNAALIYWFLFTEYVL